MSEQEQKTVEAQESHIGAEMNAPVKADVPESHESAKKRRWPVVLLILVIMAAAGFEGVQRWRIERVIDAAFERIGTRYVMGAEGPDAYDCSSLVKTCYQVGGLETPRQAVDIGYNDAWAKVGMEQLVRGDLVCFDTIRDQDESDHVGIYLGDGLFIHASSGKGRVMVSELTGYFEEHFTWGRRMLPHLPIDIPQLTARGLNETEEQ